MLPLPGQMLRFSRANPFALHLRRECVQQLLTGGGDSMAYNRDDNLPCDLSDSRSAVWTVLERDMQWRTCLQARTPVLMSSSTRLAVFFPYGHRLMTQLRCELRKQNCQHSVLGAPSSAVCGVLALPTMPPCNGHHNWSSGSWLHRAQAYRAY